MTVRVGSYYSPWPLENVDFNLQVDNIRWDTVESAKLIRNTWFDVDETALYPQQKTAIAAMEYGQNEFTNKWRWFYDRAASGAFKLQRNTGTQGSPTWTNEMSFNATTGATTLSGNLVVNTVTSTGNMTTIGSALITGDVVIGGDLTFAGTLNSVAYPNVTVREAGVNAVDTVGPPAYIIGFNVADGFYVTKSSIGQPIVNFGIPSGPGSPSALGTGIATSQTGTEWQITHNLNARPVIAQAYDNRYKLIIPDTVDTSNPNITYFYFISPVSGTAVIQRVLV